MGTARGNGCVKLRRLVSGEELVRAPAGERVSAACNVRRAPAPDEPGLAP
jgi:hypothetical protein